NTPIVFQDQQRFNFQMPHGIEQRGCTTAHTTLRAAFDCRLEVLVERNTSGMLSLATTDRAANGANAAGIDADTGALRNVADDRAGGGINRIQAIAAFNQHARAELARWRTHT